MEERNHLNDSSLVQVSNHLHLKNNINQYINDRDFKSMLNDSIFMINTLSSEIQQQLKESLNLLSTVLRSDLLGVYLYGSSLVGGLQRYSDIDLLVITNRSTTLEEQKQLVAKLLQISGLYMKGTKPPIEMTLVEKKAINPWRYPPQFDFQYGEWLRTAFENGQINLWATKDMPDLAVIITQVLLKSYTLFGIESKQLLPNVPHSDFVRAMLTDLDRLTEDLQFDTRNVLLTYARIWSTLRTNTIRSKQSAADWVIKQLPKSYQPVMQRAKSICIGLENEYWDDIKLRIKPCADFILVQIHKAALLANLNDSKRFIKLAE